MNAHLYQQRAEMAGPASGPELERLLFYWPNIMRAATEEWAQGFSRSVWKQAGRQGWRPSPKQLALMRRMARAHLANGGNDEIELIEGEG